MLNKNVSKKIAHLQLLPMLSGVQRVTLEELCRLDKDSFEAHLICKENGPLTEVMLESGVKIHTNPYLVRQISPLNDFKAFWQLYHLFRKEKFDIVHTHSSKTGILGRLAAKAAGVPKVVHTVHGFAFPAAKNPFSKWLYTTLEMIGGKCTDNLICLHSQDKDIAIKSAKVAPESISIVPNGVDSGKFCLPKLGEKELIRKSNGLEPNSIVIGMVGRLWEQKNPLLLLKAGIKLIESHKSVRIVFIGDGELQGSLQSEVHNKELEDKILFLGWRNDSHEILRSFDIFVLPSKWEGMPLAILEAASSGLPSVVSDIPGNNHLIQDGVNGLLFDSEDVNDLYLKLSKLVFDEKMRNEMGGQARKIIETHFDIDNRVKVMEKLYLEGACNA